MANPAVDIGIWMIFIKAFDHFMGPSRVITGKVRFFVDGGVIGCQEFVEDLFREKRERFGPKRRSGARPIRQCEAPLYSLRDLKVRAIE